jgi:penicillin amidase
MVNNPSEHNPERGYVSSANQHPTYPDYPYYYQGNFEFYRNQRINAVLDSLQQATPEDMMALQNDNLSLFARDAVRIIIPKLEGRSWNDQERAWLARLKNWDFTYDAGDEVAPFFEAWWEAFKHLSNDTERLNDIRLPEPKEYVLLGLIDSVPGHPYFDLDSTETREMAVDVLALAFEKSVHLIDSLQTNTKRPVTWAHYKGTHLTHWLGALKPFDVTGLPIGGNRLIVNATTADHGPSWRMIVSLEEPVQAWGVYPGGQSGNPGSPYYDHFVAKWAAGSYYPLLYLFDPEAANDRIIFRQTFAP